MREKTGSLIYQLLLMGFLLVFASSCEEEVDDDNIVNNAVIPVLSTTEVSSITQTSAVSGGNVSSDGDSEVTARGVVWSTSENPTTSTNHGITTNGAGTGSFISNLTGLTAETTYYVRAYATNSGGTAYGEQFNFTTEALDHNTCGNQCVGDTYQGGQILYFFQPGEAGYIEGECHGIIVSTTDQASSISWGCSGTFVGATGTEIGDGYYNSSIILENECNDGFEAANICENYFSGEYSDWFLPSKSTILELREQQDLISDMDGWYARSYWSSSEIDADKAWVVTTSTSYIATSTTSKTYTKRIRCVRKF